MNGIYHMALSDTGAEVLCLSIEIESIRKYLPDVVINDISDCLNLLSAEESELMGCGFSL